MGAGHSAAGSVAWAETSDSALAGASYEGNFVSVHSANFDLPPCFLGRSNASTIFAALEAADPSLSFESLVELTKHVRVVALYIGSDLCAAGQKAKLEFVRRAQAHNSCAQRSRGALGMIIVVDGHCAAHVMHREVEHVFRQKELIPSLFAVSFACGLQGATAEIMSAVARIVREDLSNGGFVLGVSPPADVFEAATSLLKLIFFREVAVRADREDIEGKRVEVVKRCRTFQALFNGDLRRPHIQHFCQDRPFFPPCRRLPPDPRPPRPPRPRATAEETRVT